MSVARDKNKPATQSGIDPLHFWVGIISAVGTSLGGVMLMALQMYLTAQRETNDLAYRRSQAEYQRTLADHVTSAAAVQDQKMEKLNDKVVEVHDLTNHMKTELVNEVRTASFAAGAKSEVDKENDKETPP